MKIFCHTDFYVKRILPAIRSFTRVLIADIKPTLLLWLNTLAISTHIQSTFIQNNLRLNSKFHFLILWRHTILTNKDVSLLMRAKLYSRCVSSCILHGREETRSTKKENELTLQQAEMRLIRWMCGIKITDMFTCGYVRETRNRR